VYERSRPSRCSPYKLGIQGSLKEIYDEILSPSFNPRKTILVQEPLNDKLVSVRASHLEIVRGGYRVTAVADGPRCSFFPFSIRIVWRSEPILSPPSSVPSKWSSGRRKLSGSGQIRFGICPFDCRFRLQATRPRRVARFCERIAGAPDNG